MIDEFAVVVKVIRPYENYLLHNIMVNFCFQQLQFVGRAMHTQFHIKVQIKTGHLFSVLLCFGSVLLYSSPVNNITATKKYFMQNQLLKGKVNTYLIASMLF